MLHFGSIDIRTDIFILILSLLFALFQVFLCFKLKKNTFRLIPVCLTLALTVLFVALGFIFDGWDGFGFFFLAGCSAVISACCGIGWAIWVILRKKNKQK